MSEAKTQTKRPCRYCANGVKLIDGDHWVVKSIIPARIDIVKCTATPAQEKRS